MLLTGERKMFPAGETIFEEGQDGDVAYVVQSGMVEISKSRGSGDMVLGHIRPGGIFGEMALVDDGPRMARAVAIDDTVCTRVDKREMQARLATADPFVEALIAILVSDLRSITQDLSSCSRRLYEATGERAGPTSQDRLDRNRQFFDT
ncbi:MAG: cyclic nucleotide-binding domain-containing protein [Acetobacterales bacterium]